MKALMFLIITLLGQSLLGQNQPKSLAKDAQEMLDKLDQHLQFTKVQKLQVKDILLRWQAERKKLGYKKNGLSTEAFRQARRKLRRTAMRAVASVLTAKQQEKFRTEWAKRKSRKL